MSRVYHTGAEWQSASTFELGSVSGALAVSTSIKYGGAASWRVTGSIAADAVIEGELPNLGNLTNFYAKGMIHVADLPSSPAQEIVAYMSFVNSGGTNVLSIQFYNDAGTLHCVVYYNDFATQAVDTSTGIAMDAWMRVEVHYDTTPANGSEILEVKVDGTTIVSLTNLNYTLKTIALYNWGVFNGSAGSISTEDVYFDDFAVNSSAGSLNNSWVGDEKIVAAVPSAAGDNAATAGTFASVNEIPATDTATSSANRIELDSNGNIADYNVTDTATLGIGSADTIKAISMLMRLREEAAGTSSYQMRIKSAASGTVASSTAADAGNATARSNPNGTTAFGRLFISETDPTTGVAWTPTGTNSIENMQIGLANVDADSTPDLWATAMAAMIAYTPATGVTLVVADQAMALGFESPALTQKHTLVVADQALGLSFEAPALTQKHTLVVQDMTFGLGFESPTTVLDTLLEVQDMAIGLSMEDAGALSQKHVLTVQDALIGLAFESPALTQKHTLVVADMAIALAFEEPALTQSQFLVVADMLVGINFENPSLTQKHTLAVADMLLALPFDNVPLIQHQELEVADMLLGTSFEEPELSSSQLLTVQDMTLGLSFEAPALTQKHSLVVADFNLQVAFDTPVLTQKHLIAVADLLLALAFEGVELSGSQALVVQDMNIGLSAEQPSLTQKHTLAVQDMAIGLLLDMPVLMQKHSLTVADLALAISMEAPTLILDTALVVADLALALGVEHVAISQKHILSVADMRLALSAESPAMTQDVLLAVSGLALALGFDNATVIAGGLPLINGIDINSGSNSQPDLSASDGEITLQPSSQPAVQSEDGSVTITVRTNET